MMERTVSTASAALAWVIANNHSPRERSVLPDYYTVYHRVARRGTV